MEDLYGVLQCSDQATEEELRQAYMKLARQYHPDKGETNAAKFIQVQKAWEILSNKQLRDKYDLRWREYCIVQGLLIQEEAKLSDFDFHEPSRTFVYPCRCGDDFSMTEADTKYHFDILSCHTCSLMIRVLYDTQPCEEDSEETDR